MEQVKKRLAQLKEEKEQAIERYEEAEKARKEAEERADQVRHSYNIQPIGNNTISRSLQRAFSAERLFHR